MIKIEFLIIDQDNSGRRLDNFIFSKYKKVPKSKIYSSIRKAKIKVNGKKSKPDYKKQQLKKWQSKVDKLQFAVDWLSERCYFSLEKSDSDRFPETYMKIVPAPFPLIFSFRRRKSGF